MGKRKKGKKAAPQKPLFMRMKIPTTFKCPICNTEESVECKMFAAPPHHNTTLLFFSDTTQHIHTVTGRATRRGCGAAGVGQGMICTTCRR